MGEHIKDALKHIRKAYANLEDVMCYVKKIYQSLKPYRQYERMHYDQLNAERLTTNFEFVFRDILRQIDDFTLSALRGDIDATSEIVFAEMLLKKVEYEKDSKRTD